MAYEVWLSFNNREEVLQLPVTPFFEIETSQGVDTVTLQKLGEISLPGLKQLKRLTLDSFFPHPDAGYKFVACEAYPPPWDCVKLIEKWKLSKRPIRVIITDTDSHINLAMLIKSFNYGVKDGTKDIEYKLDLTEYIFLDTPTLATSKATTGENAVAGSKRGATEWRVRYGDTLGGIAKAVYGDSKMWKVIYEANKSMITVLGSLKNIEGDILKIPSEYEAREPVTVPNAHFDSSNIPRKWKVKVGDTLGGIAVTAYNNKELWRLIYEANKDLIKNPNSLKGIAGQELFLPVYSENTALVD